MLAVYVPVHLNSCTTLSLHVYVTVFSVAPLRLSLVLWLPNCLAASDL